MRIAFLVLLLAGAALAQTGLITGGKAVGDIQLGQSLSRVQKLLGQADRVESSPTDPEAGMHYYDSRGLAILFGNDEKVLGVTVTSGAYRTSEGLQVGSALAEVQKHYGHGLQRGSGNLSYPDRGLAFSFSADKVTHIYVVKTEEDRPLLGDRLVVPGKRAGKLELGSAVDEVRQKWGKPNSEQPIKKGSSTRVLIYKKQAVRLVVREGKIDGILITTGDFITREGVKVGSSEAEVKRAFGSGFARKGPGLFYSSRGIGFMVGKGKVVEIQVLYPETPKSPPPGS
ncbi:MAG: hypothetical protein HY319_27855 [Armatimonadetes bacterium]|nr:hypothetical protein [Armatimonadota bacterium]